MHTSEKIHRQTVYCAPEGGLTVPALLKKKILCELNSGHNRQCSAALILNVFGKLHLQTMQPTGRAYQTDFNKLLIDMIL